MSRHKLIIYKCETCILKTEDGKCPKDTYDNAFKPGTRVGCMSLKKLDFITIEDMEIK